jgi:TonB-dependent receptor
MRSRNCVQNHVKNVLLGSTFLVGVGGAMLMGSPAIAQDQTPAVETVVVTGFRASLTEATDAKRNATNFTDSVFAEDIGKFPDTDIAESLNRIPGITINREIDGSGVNVSIRGLGTNFTKILLNNSQIAIASTGATDETNANREVDLNMFPTELFTQLTVAKTSTADTLEGGAAGTVNLRSARPFDHPGPSFTYSVQGTDFSNADKLGERGSILASDTIGPFGVLIGVAGVRNNVFTKGWEDGNAGWVTPGALSAAQCGAGNTCDQIGGNAFVIPAIVPNNVTTGGLVPGEAVNAALLQSLNPAVTTTQLSNALIPRLGRSMYERGTRDRANGIVSLEYRPMDSLHFYVDFIGGRTSNDIDRSDIDWGVRAGAGAQPMIPENLHVDANGVTTSGTFANSQFFLEARPYNEKGDFFSINPGMSWLPLENLEVDAQYNASRSHFFRDSPTFFVVTCPSAGNAAGIPGCTAPAGGVTANFSNTGGPFPVITSNINLDDASNFQWNNGRVNLQDEKRYTFTDGYHLDVKYGNDHFSFKTGLAYDEAYRSIIAIDASTVWQDAICGENPNFVLPAPNTAPSCVGLNVAGTPAAVNGIAPGSVPTYTGYGTGYSAGAPPLMYGGSLIPQASLATYLRPGPTGFITVNYAAMEAASHYQQIDNAAIAAVGNPKPGETVGYPFSTASNTGANAGIIDEKNLGYYFQADGDVNIDRDLKYDVGLRVVRTIQLVSSPVANVNPLNAGLTNGGLFPNTYTLETQKQTYTALLPAVNLVYDMTDNFLLRASVSRTMTRPNPNSMIAGVNFSDLTAQSVTLGNPDLKPYFSNNIDLGAEYYTGGEGYFAVAVFRKALSNFTNSSTITEPFSYLAQFGITYNTLVATQQAALNGRGCFSDAVCPAVVTVSEQVNEPGLLTINGIELDWVQPLDFLLERHGLKGFGYTANVTILDQSSSGAAPNHAQGVAPLSYNLTGYYENHGLSVRLSYVWNDRTYISGSQTQSVCLPSTASQPDGCPGGAYLFSAPYGQMDLSTSLKLSTLTGQEWPSDPAITFDMQNVTNSKLVTYDQYQNAVHSYYNQGQLIMFGIRGTF